MRPLLSAFVCSAIRKIFPKLLRLDGQVLPAPITFDVDTPTNLPEAKGSQFGSEQIQAVICSFINWYFARYDCDDRQQLLDVYHPQAIFSLSTHNYKVSGRNVNWTDYQNHCRNLKWAKEHQKQSRLAHGRADVVAVLCKLPPTQHSPESFVIDVGVSTPHMLTFSIQGVCKDRSSKLGKSTVRHFSRTFVTVPSNAEPGVAIINEMLVLSGAPTKEVEKYGKNLDSAPASASSSATSFDASSATVGGALTDLQQQMVQQFSVQSGMNATWSARCLSENNWDYAKAAQNFLEVNEKHMIPPEAFVQS
jgi:nuclear RNA export factor